MRIRASLRGDAASRGALVPCRPCASLLRRGSRCGGVAAPGRRSRSGRSWSAAGSRSISRHPTRAAETERSRSTAGRSTGESAMAASTRASTEAATVTSTRGCRPTPEPAWKCRSARCASAAAHRRRAKRGRASRGAASRTTTTATDSDLAARTIGTVTTSIRRSRSTGSSPARTTSRCPGFAEPPRTGRAPRESSRGRAKDSRILSRPRPATARTTTATAPWTRRCRRPRSERVVVRRR